MSQSMSMDITSANAALILTVEEIFPAGIVLEMFGTDQAFNADAVDITETRMGVDGKMAAGYVPAIQPVTITLEANSPSRAQLSTVAEAMVANKKIYACTLVATLPSVSARHTWSRGVLKNAARALSAAKTLQPTTWSFDFESFENAGI